MIGLRSARRNPEPLQAPVRFGGGAGEGGPGFQPGDAADILYSFEVSR